MNEIKRICLTPQVSGIGGMVSFQHKFAAGLEKRGVAVTQELTDYPYDAVLVIGGTRDLAGLWRTRRRGVPVVQRLNGMNWLHRLRPTGLRHYLRAEYGNLLLSLIRRRFATSIIYQSRFTRSWWEREYGPTPVPSRVIYNGVDLSVYSPKGGHPLRQPYLILMVEGSLGGGYELGLETGVKLAETLAETYHLPVELLVVGQIADRTRSDWLSRSRIPLQFLGPVPREGIPAIDRSAHVLYSADLNAACPNAVVEALACGLPVVAFDTGALPEMLTGGGLVVPYGGDPWRLDPPDINALAESTAAILGSQDQFRQAARRRAEEKFALEDMVESYLEVLGAA